MDTKSIGIKYARFMLNKSKTVSETFTHHDSTHSFNPSHRNSSSLSKLPIINLQNAPGKKRENELFTCLYNFLLYHQLIKKKIRVSPQSILINTLIIIYKDKIKCIFVQRNNLTLMFRDEKSFNSFSSLGEHEEAEQQEVWVKIKQQTRSQPPEEMSGW